MITVTRKIQFKRRPDTSKAIAPAAGADVQSPPERVPRISRLMALAIHFDRLIREGQVRDQSELARLAHVTQPRMTQIMNLNLLAPDIQQELLFLTERPAGRRHVHERMLRPLVAECCWQAQRRTWADRLANSER